MCGICGVVDWNENPEAERLVSRITPAIRHRGPDDEGFLLSEGSISGRLALGMRRLSVIDIEGGHQPVFNEDGTVGAVVNGEIYNFRELRHRLEDRGHRFRSRSDSEVVAHAYEEWGGDCVDHFEGMFAIAIYDRRPTKAFRNGSLFLARDRLGIKPLYYFVEPPASQTNGTRAQRRFVFASEVRALLASGIVPRVVSKTALESYLLFGSVSEPMTLVDGVLSLPPGHRLTVNLDDSTADAPRPKPYWTIAGGREDRREAVNGHSLDQKFREAATHVGDLMVDSVRKHLVADVPVGVFLSSGIDSTSLAALASREVQGIHTFTVAFPDKEFSEAAIARHTAGRLGTTHKEVMLSGDTMLGRIDEAVAALDQPSMDGINTFFVSDAARAAGLKVALSGLGGDEVFGGYETFQRTPALELIGNIGSKVPNRMRAKLASVATVAAGHGISADGVRKVTALWNSNSTLPHPYFFGRALFTPPQVSDLLLDQMPRNGESLWWHWLQESAAMSGSFDPFGAITCMETRSYLVNTLLRDTDAMSMAHSLEVRVPFLDHRLVEFVASLPQQLKLRKGQTKALLVAALEDLLPSQVVSQPKRGFQFPWAAWLRGPLKEKLDKGLTELTPALTAKLSSANVQEVWRSYLDENASWSRPWSLYVLNEWVSRHL